MPIHLKHSIIRPLTMADAEHLAIMANNVRIWNQVRNAFPQPYWYMDAVRYISSLEAQDPLTTFCIEVDGRCAGVCGLKLQSDYFHRSAELGYWLGEPYWGRGIMSEVVPAISKWGFANFPHLNRQFAYAFESNPGSMRILEKAGFHEEAVLKKAADKKGVLLDLHIWVKLI